MQKEESLRNIRNASTASKFLFSSAHMDENRETGGKVVIMNFELRMSYKKEGTFIKNQNYRRNRLSACEIRRLNQN